MYLNLDSYSYQLYKNLFLKYLLRKYFFFYRYTTLPKVNCYAKYKIKLLDEIKAKDTLILNSWLFLYKLFIKPFSFVELKNFFSTPKSAKQQKISKNLKIRKKLYNITSLGRFTNRICFSLMDNILFFLLRSKIAEFLVFKAQKSRICVNLELIKIFPEINQNLVFDKVNSTLNIFFFYKLSKYQFMRAKLPTLYHLLMKDLTNFLQNILL